MELDFAAWMGLALRWFHVMAGIMWIGASVYFVWLDLALLPIPRQNEIGTANERGVSSRQRWQHQ